MRTPYSQYLLALLTVSFTVWGSILAVSLARCVRTEKSIRLVHWVLLGAVLAVGIGLRFFWMPHQFRVFYDGYEIVNLSKNIADRQSFSQCRGGTLDDCELEIMPSRPPAFSVLGAAAMKLSGLRTPEVIFSLNSLIGVLCIGMMFLLVFCVTRDAGGALLAAAMTAVLPLHIKMSSNASSEMFNFLLVCSMLYFLHQFLKSGALLQFTGMAASIHLAFFNRTENMLFLVLLPLAIFTFTDRQIRARVIQYFFHGWVLIIASIIPLIDMFLNIHYIHMGHMELFYTKAPVETLIRNIIYLCGNDYVPFAIVGPALAGMALLWTKASFTAKLMAAQFLINFVVISLVNVGLWIGDFPRLLIGMTVTLFFWAALSVSQVARQCGPRRVTAAFGVYLVLLLAGMNMKPPPFHVYIKYHEAVLRKFIPEVPSECSFYAPNPEMFFVYTGNRAYRIRELLDEAFMARHKECKILVREVLCSSSYRKLCEAVSKKYPQKIIYRHDVSKSRAFIISEILEKDRK